MTITTSDIDNLLSLAKLKISANQKKDFENDLTKIVSLVESLLELDLTNIEPMSHTTEETLFLREDLSKSAVGQKGLSSSLGYEEGLVKVPKIIE